MNFILIITIIIMYNHTVCSVFTRGHTIEIYVEKKPNKLISRMRAQRKLQRKVNSH